MASRNYLAPWAERLPQGGKVEYGPSPATHQRLDGEHKMWSWKPAKIASRLSRGHGSDELRAYMRPDGEHLRGDVPPMELRVYVMVFEDGRSVRWVARKLERSRRSVRTWVARLRERVG